MLVVEAPLETHAAMVEQAAEVMGVKMVAALEVLEAQI